MTLEAVRYLEKFESVDGLTSYAFPVDDYEYEPAQAFRRAEAAVVGADHAVDFLGAAPWPKAVGEEAVRFRLVRPEAGVLGNGCSRSPSCRTAPGAG